VKLEALAQEGRSSPPENTMRRRRKLLTLLLVLSMLAAIAWTPPSAECFGCTAADKHYCTEKALQDFNDCFQLYGTWVGSFVCPDTFDRSYETCLMVKGCPITPAKI
jgi:hypothetical protein